MPRRILDPAPPAAQALPHVIDPRAVYFPEDVRRIFRLKASTIRREVREGRLRVAKRAGRYYLLGAWLLAWIEAGELKRCPAADRGGTPAA
jgi:hypothetical protein